MGHIKCKGLVVKHTWKWQLNANELKRASVTVIENVFGWPRSILIQIQYKTFPTLYLFGCKIENSYRQNMCQFVIEFGGMVDKVTSQTCENFKNELKFE